MIQAKGGGGPDLAEMAVRAVVLYSLMEHQAGNASTIRVTKRGRTFSVSDDGRGHSLDRTVRGTSYLSFVYTHFEYPFETVPGVPVQLHGIGTSLVNALCTDLTLTVRKHDETLTIVWKNAMVHDAQRAPTSNEQTGLTLEGRVRDDLLADEASIDELEAWLQRVSLTHPRLSVFLNDRPVASRT